jgi:hypothetical protein
MKKKKIIIFAPHYNPDSGGAIATHKLCHLLNEMGREAFLFPLFDTHPINILNFESTIEILNNELFYYSVDSTVKIENKPVTSSKPLKELAFKERLQLARRIFFPPKKIQATETLPIIFNPNRFSLQTNPSFNTPCLDIRSAHEIAGNDEYVVIYPEVVMGNPLKAKNVVRWLLHTPGFHTNQTNYGPNELYFRFSVETPYFSHPGSTTSDQFLTVVHFPTEIYNMNGASQDRQGTAYCIRKGAGKEIVHDLSDSICIDGKSHKEIAEILKRVKTFYCYDTRTAYYYFASLCGCETIVIPDDGISKEEWLPLPISRVGIRYGIDSPKNFSQNTPNDVLAFLKAEEISSIARIKTALQEIDKYDYGYNSCLNKI